MPVKIARSSPSTIVRAARAAGSHPHLASVLLQGRKKREYSRQFGSHPGIPAKDKITLRNRARVLEAELGGLAGRLRVPAQVRQGVLSLYSRKEFQ